MKQIIALLLISLAMEGQTTPTILATSTARDGSPIAYYSPPCNAGDHKAPADMPDWCEHITKLKKAKPKPSVKKKAAEYDELALDHDQDFYDNVFVPNIKACNDRERYRELQCVSGGKCKWRNRDVPLYGWCNEYKSGALPAPPCDGLACNKLDSQQTEEPKKPCVRADEGVFDKDGCLLPHGIAGFGTVTPTILPGAAPEAKPQPNGIIGIGLTTASIITMPKPSAETSETKDETGYHFNISSPDDTFRCYIVSALEENPHNVYYQGLAAFTVSCVKQHEIEPTKAPVPEK